MTAEAVVQRCTVLVYIRAPVSIPRGPLMVLGLLLLLLSPWFLFPFEQFHSTSVHRHLDQRQAARLLNALST